MQPIASRQFADRNGNPVVLRIYQPELSADRNLWSCGVAVSVGSEEFETSAVGKDSLQALILAIDLARQEVAFLSDQAGPFQFLGKPDLGFHFKLEIPDKWRTQRPFDPNEP